MLESMHGTVKADAEAVLLPLLVSLLSTLWPLEDHATPSLAVREAIHRCLAAAYIGYKAGCARASCCNES